MENASDQPVTRYNSALHTQKTVSAYFASEQLLPSGFVECN